MTKSVDEILRSGADTYERKTADYGSSWRSIGYIIREMAHGEPIVLDSSEEIIAFGLFTRRLDKLSREFFGTFFADSLNFEGPVDSAEDESVYASMSAANLYDMAEQAAESEEDDAMFEAFDRTERYPEQEPPEPDYDFEERVLAWADDLVGDMTTLFSEDVIAEFPRDEEREMAFTVLEDADDWTWDPYTHTYCRT